MIRVVGVGGAGVNAVNRMVEAEVEGVEFLAINTDLQSLQLSAAHETVHIGDSLTRGLGSGSDPDLGRQAAREEYDRIKAMLRGSDMIFIAAGAGGGTGTGAAPIVAHIARELGALTVGIVTRPFQFEGSRRRIQAEQGIVCCWTGTGASIAANKVPGVRAALCDDAETARGARKWNDANVLALSLRRVSEPVLEEILDAWFEGEASAEPDDVENIRHVDEIR